MSISDVQERAAVISKTWRSRTIAIGALFTTLILVGVFATTLGSVNIPFGDTFSILFSKLPFLDITPTWPPAFEVIISNIRLPRVLLACIVGVALAVAGASYQGLFRNPLADPYLIGVAQGAALGAVLGFLFPIAIFGSTAGVVPIFAFIGALVSVAVVYMLARVGGVIPVTTLILAGVAMGALFSAMVSYLITISGDKIHGIIFWMMGSFSSSQWTEVKITWPIILIGVAIIFLFARALNIMQLGEEQAKQLGIDVEKVKIILLAVSTLITAAAVSFVGIIGFVGIIVPHAVRLVWGPDHRFLLPLSALVGAIFMILADIIARTLLAPTEIPIGIITAISGAPFFLYLLRKRTKVLF